MNDLFEPSPVHEMFPLATDQWKAALGRNTTIELVDNPWHGKTDEFSSYRAALDCGRTYLGGPDYPMDKFLKDCTEAIESTWLQQAVQFASQYPQHKLIIIDPVGRRHWDIHARGNYVEVKLPHHGWGGEKAWISGDLKHMVLVNQD